MLIRPYRASDQAHVIQLWKNCGLVVPHNNPEQDIARKLAHSPDWFIVGEKAGKLVATCMAGYDGHRGWINYLAVAPEERRQGYARAMMDHAEALLKAAGCPKINLQVRARNESVISFYERIGFAGDATVSLGKRLETDRPHGL